MVRGPATFSCCAYGSRPTTTVYRTGYERSWTPGCSRTCTGGTGPESTHEGPRWGIDIRVPWGGVRTGVPPLPSRTPDGSPSKVLTRAPPSSSTGSSNHTRHGSGSDLRLGPWRRTHEVPVPGKTDTKKKKRVGREKTEGIKRQTEGQGENGTHKERTAGQVCEGPKDGRVP